MKQLHSFSIILMLLIFTKNLEAQQSENKKGSAVVKSNLLKSKLDSLDYAIGASAAKWLLKEGFSIEKLSLFTAGLSDFLKQTSGKQLSEQQVATLLEQTQKERGLKQEQRLFNSLKDKPNIGMLPNGVRYMILKKGTGRQPLETDSLQLHIYARLTDSTVLENTYQNKQPVINAPNNFFPGIKESLLMMSAGSKWQLYIPANQAFGEKGNQPRIPPNSPLIIDVEIVSFSKND